MTDDLRPAVATAQTAGSAPLVSPPALADPAPSEPPGIVTPTPFRSPSARAGAVLSLLALWGVAASFALAARLAERELVARLVVDPATVSAAQLETSDARVLASAIALTAVQLLSGIAFISWQWRVHANLPRSGPGAPRHGRGWVIFGWIRS